MKSSLLLLLHFCLWPLHQPSRKPTNIKTRTNPSMKLPKANDGAKHSVIDFSDDIDNEPDSRGEFTMASLTKPDMPRDFTICAAFMVKAWTADFSVADLFELMDDDGDRWAYLFLYAGETYTEFTVMMGKVFL